MNAAPPGDALRAQFISGMSHAACTVNVVTTDGPAGRAGVTVSAMASVSADTPRPTLLVCINELSTTAEKILQNGVFCVNVLRDSQGYISDTFAGRFRDRVTEKFEVADWVAMPSGSPRVTDPLVAFDCSIVSCEKVGTHFVVMGEVDDIFTTGQGSPLIYANRAYGTPSRIETPPDVQATPDDTLTVGCFSSFGPYILPELAQRLAQDMPGLKLALIEGDRRRIEEALISGEADLGLMHDVALSPELQAIPLHALAPHVLLPSDHPLADRATVSPADLSGERLVLLETLPGRERYLEAFARAGAPAQIAFRSTSFEMVRGMVGHGLGYALVATKPASPLTYDGRAVSAVPLTIAADPGNAVLAHRRKTTLSAAAEYFADLSRAMFAPAPDREEHA